MTHLIDLKLKRDRLRARLAAVNEAGRDKELERVGDYFHLGRVGGSGRRTAHLNRRREAALDRAIDAARTATDLQAEITELTVRITDIQSGAVEARAAAHAALVELTKQMTPGQAAHDAIYGDCTVVRVNKKTITIQTADGYREARPFGLVSPKTLPAGFTFPPLPAPEPYPVGRTAFFYLEGRGCFAGIIWGRTAVEGMFRPSWRYRIEPDKEEAGVNEVEVPHYDIRFVAEESS